MSVKFGTSGLRGLSVDLVGLPSFLYVSAFCAHLKKLGVAREGDYMLVGQDYRPSSPDIAAFCMGAIEQSGLVPIDCGALPTPALASYGQMKKAASVMITGSHIPADRNGIKFYLPEGEITKEDELAISAWADRLGGTISQMLGQGAGEAKEAYDHFLSRNKALLPTKALAGLKVGVYQHSTVARDLFVELLEYYGATVTPLGRSDRFIPVDTEAVSGETISLLKKWSVEGGYDAIISADGDADRPLVADETGAPLRGDLLGLMTARFLGAKIVSTPVTSNSGIEKNGDFEVIRTKVGSPFVIAGMMSALEDGRSAIVGFEANGGFLTASPFTPAGAQISALPTRDCVLPILSALYLTANSGKPLSQLTQDFKLPVAAADRIKDFAQERSSALMAYIRASHANLSAFLAPIGKVASTSDIDGLRVTLEDRSIIHFRPSGNAPEMRCYVEAETQEAADELLAKGLELITNFETP